MTVTIPKKRRTNTHPNALQIQPSTSAPPPVFRNLDNSPIGSEYKQTSTLAYSPVPDVPHPLRDPKRGERRIAKAEKRRTAYHEASHLIVLRHLGGIGSARIWRNSIENVIAGQSAWLGCCRMLAKPGTVNSMTGAFSHYVRKPTPKRWRRYIGLSGLVGEAIANGMRDSSLITDEIYFRSELREVSDSDLTLMDNDWQERDVNYVMTLLLKHWSEVEFEVKCLSLAR